MSETRDPRVAALVTRLVEQAPPAPPFPERIIRTSGRSRRNVVLAGVVVGVVAVVVAVIILVATNRTRRPSITVANPTTTTTHPPTTVEALPPLGRPSALAVGPDGRLYVADTGTHRVVVLGAGGADVVDAHVGRPLGLAFDHDGNLYVADAATDTVLRVAPDGTVTVYAGDGTAGFAGDGGPATRAELSDPTGLAFGPDGALYISDSSNGRIRRVAPDGVITTYAGNGSASQTGDGGPAVDAGLDPQALAFDGRGNLDVFQFDVKAIRRITPAGIISSLPKAVYASGLATTPDGDVDVADYGAFGISRIAPAGTIAPVPFRHSGVFRPVAIAVAPNGDVYVADDGVSGGGPRRIFLVHLGGTSVDITPRA